MPPRRALCQHLQKLFSNSYTCKDTRPHTHCTSHCSHLSAGTASVAEMASEAPSPICLTSAQAQETTVRTGVKGYTEGPSWFSSPCKKPNFNHRHQEELSQGLSGSLLSSSTLSNKSPFPSCISPHETQNSSNRGDCKGLSKMMSTKNYNGTSEHAVTACGYRQGN